MGVPVPEGMAAMNSMEAEKACGVLGGRGVVKAQVHSGGRGLGRFDNGYQGGVHVVDSAGEAGEVAGKMLGARLITKQTGSAGLPCNVVYVSARVDVRRELYLALLLDRGVGGPAFVGSAQGGTSIEELAKTDPDAIFRVAVPVGAEEVPQEIVDELCTRLDAREPASVRKDVEAAVKGMYKAFVDYDCTQVEINPLALTADAHALAIDAKLNFDSNALYRQPKIAALKDESQEDPRDAAAEKFDLNYIGLDGSIGCLVNGAGLAMATMDIIKLHGSEPANFLDVGGGATEEQVLEAFRILTRDSNVRCILVNIFGGIMKCDIIAQGIVAAVRKLNMTVPLVVRLEGTNSDLAKSILKDANLDITAAEDLDNAAKLAVETEKKLLQL